MGFAPGAEVRITRSVHTAHCVCAGAYETCPAYLSVNPATSEDKEGRRAGTRRPVEAA